MESTILRSPTKVFMNCYRTKSNLFLLWVHILTCVPGCGSEPPIYSFVFKDRTGIKRHEGSTILYQWGNTSFLGGTTGSIGLFRDPWPSELVLNWQDPNGKPLKDKNGKPKEKISIVLPEMKQERWEDIKDVYVYFLPDDKIIAEAFTRQEKLETDKVDKFLSQGQPTYSIGLKNNTPKDFTNTSLRFGEYYLYPEQLAPLKSPHKWNPTGWELLEGFPFPVTDTATIQWTTPDGITHKQEVQMKGNLPKDLNNQTLGFIIEPDNTVKFQVRPFDQYETWSQEGRVWKKP